jgi:hypothetical protein
MCISKIRPNDPIARLIREIRTARLGLNGLILSSVSAWLA